MTSKAPIFAYSLVSFQGEGHVPASINTSSFFFSAGEPHVVVDDPVQVRNKVVWIDWPGNGHFMHLLTAIDAIQACGPAWLGVFMPYFPGARQDRRQLGTPLTARVYADAINQARVDAVMIIDPHSDVTPALIDRVHVIQQHEAMLDLPKYDAFICPDAGAQKRVYATAEALGQYNIIHASKHRDTSTGKLSGFRVEPFVCSHSGRYLIVDDICDGGRTFIGLAGALPSHINLDLWVTHGIFSAGVMELLQSFGTIHTTDSWCHLPHFNDRVVVHSLNRLAANTVRMLTS
jgi:ribose-phosphate pyrophosphokinase